MEQKQMITRNCLTAREMRRLGDWLLNVWEQIVRERWTQPHAAGRASEALGIEVTVPNITKATQSVDKSWPTRSRDGDEGSARDVAVLAEQLAELMAASCAGRVPSPSQGFRELCERVGVAPRMGDMFG